MENRAELIEAFINKINEDFYIGKLTVNLQTKAIRNLKNTI